MRIVIRQNTSVDDMNHVAGCMRGEDVREVWASSHSTPIEALLRSVSHSDRTWTGFMDDEPTAVFGIGTGSVLTGVGVPWLLGTYKMRACVPGILRRSRIAVDELQARYPVMRNVIDDRNAVSRRWLRWLGFTETEPFPYGPDRLLFRLFERRAPHV